MEQLHLQWSDLGYMTPELTLVIAAVVLSLLDLVLPKRINRTMLGWLSLASILISIGFVISFLQPAEPKQLLGLSYRIDDFANIIKLILLTGAGFVTFMSIGLIKEREIPHIGEFFYLLLPATLGGMIMASSGDLITLFVGLELLSITSYILVAMRKKIYGPTKVPLNIWYLAEFPRLLFYTECLFIRDVRIDQYCGNSQCNRSKCGRSAAIDLCFIFPAAGRLWIQNRRGTLSYVGS